MCARHANWLPLRPGFETKAEELMARCEATLATALANVRQARAEYRGKEIGT
jgi:hypothetical protein